MESKVAWRRRHWRPGGDGRVARTVNQRSEANSKGGLPLPQAASLGSKGRREIRMEASMKKDGEQRSGLQGAQPLRWRSGEVAKCQLPAQRQTGALGSYSVHRSSQNKETWNKREFKRKTRPVNPVEPLLCRIQRRFAVFVRLLSKRAQEGRSSEKNNFT